MSTDQAVVKRGPRTARPRAAKPAWFSAFCVGAALFLVYLTTASYGTGVNSQNNDVVSMSLSAWRLGQYGNINLDAFEGWSWVVPSDIGFVSNRFPGTFLVASPFYTLLGIHAAPTVLPGVVAAAAVTAAAMGILFALLRKVSTTKAAIAGTAIVALAGPTWSVSADGLWAHGFTQLWLLLGVLLGVRGGWLASGLSYGMGILTRPHVVAVPATQFVWLALHRRPRAAMWLGAGAFAGVLALLVYNHQVFGAWSVLGGYDSAHMQAEGVGAKGFLVNIVGALVSPLRGVLVLMPFFVLLSPGLRGAWQQAPDWVRSAAVGGAAYAILQHYLIRFSGGNGFYSNRVLIESMTLAAPLGLLAYRHGLAHRPLLRALFWVLVVWAFSTHAFASVTNWTPEGQRDPWRTFLLGDLLAHAGPGVTVAWALATAALMVIAARWAMCRTPEPQSAGQQLT